MLESLKSEEFTYQKVSPEEQKKRGILGRLVGVIADFKNPTRNNRFYSESTWDKLFESEVMQERIKNRCCFGHLEHPSSGTRDIDPEKVAIALAEPPKKTKDGKLMGVFDILDLPMGRILKTMIDYGTKIGVSSRGEGDTYTNQDGVEEVDPSTYNSIGWDAVIIPAVKDARLTPVMESLNTGKKKVSLVESLGKLVNESNEKDRKVITEELNRLHIAYEPSVRAEALDINAKTEKEEADNVGAEINALRDSLKKQQELEDQVRVLQEKLSVSYTQVADLKEELDKHKKSTRQLNESVNTVNSLNGKIASLENRVEMKTKTITQYQRKTTSLQESLKESEGKCNSLQETLTKKDNALRVMSKKMNSLQESFDELKSQSEEEKSTLMEQLAEKDADEKILRKNYSESLSKSNALVERYKKIAQKAVDKYIESKATSLGVKPSEIKSRLSENYSFDDIDAACDSVREYKVNRSNLPIFETLSTAKKVTVKKDPIKESIVPVVDDGTKVDENLIKFMQSMRKD